LSLSVLTFDEVAQSLFVMLTLRNFWNTLNQCFGSGSESGSAFDGLLDPDPAGGKSAQKKKI
jgi:hypothetical protein